MNADEQRVDMARAMFNAAVDKALEFEPDLELAYFDDVPPATRRSLITALATPASMFIFVSKKVARGELPNQETDIREMKP